MTDQLRNIALFSRWGVQIEGDPNTIVVLRDFIHGSIATTTSPFITMLNEVPILRSSAWDEAATFQEAEPFGQNHLALLVSCINVLDGCPPLATGTIYEFTPAGKFNMHRNSPVTVWAGKAIHERSTSAQFGVLYRTIGSNKHLQQASHNLRPEADWLELYQAWEALRDFSGGEPRLKRLLGNDFNELKRASRTANTFRHIAPPPMTNPMSKAEAADTLKSALRRAAGSISEPEPGPDTIKPGTKVDLPQLTAQPGTPTSLQRLRPDNVLQVGVPSAGSLVPDPGIADTLR